MRFVSTEPAVLQVEPKASYITALLSSVRMVGPVMRGKLSRCVAKSQLDAVSCGRSWDRTYIVPVESLHVSSLAPVQQSLNSQTPETGHSPLCIAPVLMSYCSNTEPAAFWVSGHHFLDLFLLDLAGQLVA